MAKYIAFLRGINVGGHQVKMERLRALFTELKLNNVRSYINSGNIFFETNLSNTEDLTQLIEEQLAKSLGYQVPTFIRTFDDVEAILALEPFRGIELTANKRFLVIFTKEQLDSRIKLPHHSNKGDIDLIAINDREAFVVWHIIDSRPPSGKFDRAVIPPDNTARFYHTFVKILAAAKSD